MDSGRCKNCIILVGSTRKIVLGGDILNPDFSYAYENWYYNPKMNLSVVENRKKSIVAAMEYLDRCSEEFGNNYFVILVVGDYSGFSKQKK